MAIALVLLKDVILSYHQTICVYPNSGGFYIVAHENLGLLAGLVVLLIRSPISSMYKLLPAVLVTTTLFIGFTEGYPIATAGTCVAASSCGRQPIKFIPGQRITVEVVNLTESVVQLQKIAGTDPVAISPGQVFSFARGGKTEPNFSVVLWDAIGLPVKVNILKPEARTLRIEVRPGGRPPGDRSVYLKDDGRVAVF